MHTTRSMSPAYLGLVLLAGWGGCQVAPKPAATRPFSDRPHAIPGTIEAEHFDEGPAGTAYRDFDSVNQGAPLRKTEVDIEARPDASGGHGVGWTKRGEWLAYTVDVAEAGAYMVEIPAASPQAGAIVHLEIDGKDVSGPIEMPNTGDWQKLGTATKSGIELPAGRHELRLVFDKETGTLSVADVDLMRFKR